MRTFTEFKEQLYNKITDISLFDCGDINLFKVVLDGLQVDYYKKGKVRPLSFYPLVIYKLALVLKRTRRSYSELQLKKQMSKHSGKIFLISDVGWTIKGDGDKLKSVYFENITKILGRENVVQVADTNFIPTFEHDVKILDLKELIEGRELSPDDIILREEMLRTYGRIKASGIFSNYELKNIKYAFHKFFQEFRVWDLLLTYLPKIRKAFFVCHYHKEGQIYAYRKYNIQNIEFQHGIIAPQDIFYVMPEAVKAVQSKILCADKILVYGKYWKDTLEKGYEYRSDQIEVVGYYQYEGSAELNASEKNIKALCAGKKNIILITTQTYLHKHFIRYTLWLQDQLSGTSSIILLKPHPAEDATIYTNAFESSAITHVVTEPISVLFKSATLHVSIYSTTLYDALRYNVYNYSLFVEECKDYISSILESNIAQKVTFEQNPLDLPVLNRSQEHETNYFFSDFNPSEINKI